MRYLLVFAALLAAGVVQAAPRFTEWQGEQSVGRGRGGEVYRVDGIEFWSSGGPPRAFEVLGFLTDRRHSSGLLGAIRMAGLDDAIARAADEHGGDAVIQVYSESDVIGLLSGGQATVSSHGNSAYGYGSSYSAPISKNDSKFIVVRYVKDEPPPADPGSEWATELKQGLAELDARLQRTDPHYAKRSAAFARKTAALEKHLVENVPPASWVAAIEGAYWATPVD